MTLNTEFPIHSDCQAQHTAIDQSGCTETEENPMLTAALGYAAQGISIFPCLSSGKLAKKPLTDHGFKEASCEPEQIKFWWQKYPTALIGAPTGYPMGAFVLDIDVKNGVDGYATLATLESIHGSLPDSKRVKTASGGGHIYFKCPQTKVKNSAGKLGPGIDVRGDGGYIILPPSNIAGMTYQLINDTPIAEAPEWLLILMNTAKKHKKSVQKTPAVAKEAGTSAYGKGALKRECAEISNAVEGTRNDQLNRSSFNLGQLISGGELHESYAFAALEIAANTCGLPESESIKTITRGLADGKRSPRSKPRTNIVRVNAQSNTPNSEQLGNVDRSELTEVNIAQTNLHDNEDNESNSLPYGFEINERGTWFNEVREKGTFPVRLGPPIEIVAMSRNAGATGWGLVLRWHDPDRNPKQYILPFSSIIDSRQSWRAEMCDRGWIGSSDIKARSYLAKLLSSVIPHERARCVENVGWIGNSFVLPDSVIGDENEELIVLQGGNISNPFKTKGTLDGWQQTIGTWCRGNSRLMFAVSIALAATLLNVLGAEGGAINFFGRSSSGKTTILKSGMSVWGESETPGTWRSTANGLEGILALHNDLVLALDELGQAAAKEVGDIVYMIANGKGKSRANQDGSAKSSKSWRCLVLSTGELTMADIMSSQGQQFKAGQEVRFVDLPADPGKNLGVFECLHGHSSSKEFAEAIQAACRNNFGFPGREFTSQLIQKIEEVKSELKFKVDACASNMTKESSSSQVKRVSSRFALIALAGEMAVEFGILPWEIGESTSAATCCFEDWLLNRGDTGDREQTQILEHLKLVIVKYGQSKFQSIDSDNEHVIERVGFKRKSKNGEIEYLFTPEQFKSIFSGFNINQVKKVLQSKGMLRHREKNDLTTKITIKNLGEKRVRCYVIVIDDLQTPEEYAA